FRVVGLTLTRLDQVKVTFAHAHPFAAPDLTRPPTGANRADLGYTGRLLVLADLTPAEEATHSFFGGTIKAQTALVDWPDGYVNPGTLLHQTGLRANTFPYVLLADEAQDNRAGISNGGIPGGNYDAGFGGWQRGNLGTGNVGWTGFDYIHGGQEIVNSFVLDRAALLAAGAELQVALLLKYTEPKAAGGVPGRALRLPPEVADVSQFAYRLPHAALDASVAELSLTPDNEPDDIVQVHESGGPGSPLDLQVRDWDAQATEAATPGIATSPVVNEVEPGAAGQPTVDFDCPAMVPGPVPLSPTDPDAAGIPGDEIPYRGTLTNQLGVSLGADRFRDLPALFRVVDPEAIAPPPGSPHFGVDPVTLAPDAARALLPVTYQAVTVRLVPPEPTWRVHIVDPNGENGDFAQLVTLPGDPGDPLDDRLAVAYQGKTGGAGLRFAVAQTAA
ncbi:MAG TPA: hypothetical protein VEI97_16155, partial [bacterium]|nr:hypothetical protein [bacterium]